MSDVKALLNPRTALMAALLAAVGWSSWPVLTEMAARWSTDPRYSHGYVIPLFALAILWLRWDRCPSRPAAPDWWGLGPIALGAALQLVGTYVFNYWLQGMALIAYAAGIALLFGGWRGLRWAAPAIAFLLFMIPLPFQFEAYLGQRLQRISTVVSVFLLQLMGLPVNASGNVIRLGSHLLNVAEACSGLSMLMTFFALAAAVAILIDRPWPIKALVLLSAPPIAIVANVLRIALTAVLYQVAGSERAEWVFHDVAGWLMMPLGLGLLWAELWLISKLLVLDDGDDGEGNPGPPVAVGAGAVEGPGLPGRPPLERMRP